MRAPLRSASRPVNRDSTRPAPNSAASVTTTAAWMARNPAAPARNGSSGTAAPAAKATNEVPPALPGRAEIVRVESELLARPHNHRLHRPHQHTLTQNTRLHGIPAERRIHQ